jgi:uridylate kinase
LSDGAAAGERHWGRIVLKLSGEAFAGGQDFGIDQTVVDLIAHEVVEVRKALDTQIAIVVGGGNIWRGQTAAAAGLDRSQGDYMGMLATVINSLDLQATLERMGQPTRVQSAIEMSEIAEPYIRRRAIRHLEKGRVVIFAAGTGNPFFTTDTAAALRASEIHAEAILMAKNGVEGVFTADPAQDPAAEFLPEITYMDAIQRRLSVMDATALTLCMENELPLYVFNMDDEENILRIISGERVGTLVST